MPSTVWQSKSVRKSPGFGRTLDARPWMQYLGTVGAVIDVRVVEGII